jgi:ribonuclease HIII
MHVKKIDDSKVDEIIKKAEEAAAPHSVETIKEKTPKKTKRGELMNAIVILALLGLSIIQSVELINLRSQLKDGQFGGSAGNPATGGDSGLPSQQGGC